MPDPRDFLPLPPWVGPPIPRGLADILTPPLPLKIHNQREGIRKLNEVIDLYLRHAGELTDEEIAHVDELVRLRDAMVRRLAIMKQGR